MFTQIESILPNTIMELHESGNFYRIRPAEGYKLHTKELDYDEYDEQGQFLENKKGYTSVFTTCPINYNFSENPREIYAVEVI
jgi:hypothetical protein